VKRDGTGGFAAGAVSATSVTSTGAVTAATATITGAVTQGSAVFKDSASGTVTVQAPTTVSPSYVLTLPTSAGGSDQVLKTDASGQLSWTSLPTGLPPTGAAGGDLTGTYPNPTVATVGGSTAANINSAELLANAATAANTSNAIVKRDGSGNFAANVGTFSGVALSNAGSLVNLVNPIGAAYTLTLPTGVGANGQVLTTDGAGALSWTAGGASLWTTHSSNISYDGGGNVGIGTTSPVANLDVKGDIAISGSTSGAVKFAAPAVAGSATYTWPSAAPASNMVLQSDASGALSWVAASSGPVGPPGVPGPAGASPWGLNGLDTYYTDGNVGIGTTSPGYPLTISSNAATPLVLLQRTSSNNSNVLYSNSVYSYYAGLAPSGNFAFGLSNNLDTSPTFAVTQSGKVGVGTSNPGYKLDVNGTVNGTQLCIAGTCKSSWPSGGGGLPAANGSASAPSINFTSDTGTGFYRYGSGMIGLALSGTHIGFISSSSFDIDGLEVYGDSFRAASTGTAGRPAYSDPVSASSGLFFPSNSVALSVNSNERFRISNSGNVGIGTTSPGYKLDVNGVANATQLCIAGDCKSSWPSSGGSGDFMKDGTVAMTGALKLSTSGTVFAPSLTMSGDTNSGFYEVGSGFWSFSSGGSDVFAINYAGPILPARVLPFTPNTGTLAVDSGDSNKLKWYDGTAWQSAGSAWTVSGANAYRSGGNVGIGTTSPTASLDVKGTIKSTVVSVASPGVSGFDWSKGNIQYTSASCTGATWNFTNVSEGTTYTLVVQGNSHTGTCAFSEGSTFKFNPANAAPSAASDVIYSFMKVGSTIYVSWIDGW
jgi:hypothetical protein